MALITCKDCKKEFSTDAKRCLHCGAKKPGSQIVRYGLWAIVAVGLIIPFVGSKTVRDARESRAFIGRASAPAPVDPMRRAEEVLRNPNADNFARSAVIVDLEEMKANSEPAKTAKIEELLAAVRKGRGDDGEPQSEGAWRLERSRSQLDDSETVVLYLDANEPIQAWLRSPVPTLFIRCKENKTEVYIRTETSANPELSSYSQATVRLRLDKKPAFKQTWSESTDNEALFAPGAIELARKLAKAEILTFEFTPFNASPAVATFTVAGLGDHLGMVAEACHWKY